MDTHLAKIVTETVNAPEATLHAPVATAHVLVPMVAIAAMVVMAVIMAEIMTIITTPKKVTQKVNRKMTQRAMISNAHHPSQLWKTSKNNSQFFLEVMEFL